MLQKYFSDATNESVQLFCITNYPDRIPSPVLSRLAEVLYFDKSSPKTLQKLLKHHLGRALGNKKLAQKLADQVLPENVQGLVGRDIQYIATRLALRKKPSADRLNRLIGQVKEDKQNTSTFKMESERAKSPPPVTSKSKRLWS